MLISFIQIPSNGDLQAEVFRDSFESDQLVWTAHFPSDRVQLKQSQKNTQIVTQGQLSERFQFVTQSHDVPIALEYRLEPIRILDELNINLAIHCNRPGTKLMARVVFPHQIDPKTNAPLTRLIEGQVSDASSRWTRLTCQTTDQVMSRHLILWRAALKPHELDTRDLYLDRIYLSQTLGPGITEIAVDDLQISPRVLYRSANGPDEQTDSLAGSPNLTFRLEHLFLNDRPFFPVIFPHQREPFELLKECGANVVWVSRYEDQQLMNQLQSHGLWATSWPPSAKSSTGELLAIKQASLTPFGSETNRVLFWNLGVRIQPAAYQQMKHWINQVKTSDRDRHRPVLADVHGQEQIASRDVDMLGISQHVIHTSQNFLDYYHHLRTRMKFAQPGTFLLTWLQTEPTRNQAETRARADWAPLVVEPEQIRLQTYAALSAGCRGLGYWNWTALNSESIGSEERRLILKQLSLERKLLEPFLANGDLADQFMLDAPHDRTLASMIRGEHGLAILLTTLGGDSQFVPDQLVSKNVKLTIRGLPESALLWRITTTGVWPLESRRVTGGTEVRIPEMNMTAAVIATTDQGVIHELNRQVKKMAPLAAENEIQLAVTKLSRVEEVHQELLDQQISLATGHQILYQAREFLTDAELQLERQEYQQAQLDAERCSQSLRIYQHAHWQKAIEQLSAPTSTAHTLCFQTLPDFWRLLKQVSRSDAAPRTLLNSGAFEDPEAMLIEGWTRDINTSSEIVVYDALDPSPHQGEYCLRMASIASEPNPSVHFSDRAVRYQSPPIAVNAGELIHISGWIRVPREFQGQLSRFRIFETSMGPAGSLVWKTQTEWKPFELIREVDESKDVHVAMELYGLGDVAIDDLKIKVIRLPDNDLIKAQDSRENPSDSTDANSRSNALEFLNRLIK